MSVDNFSRGFVPGQGTSNVGYFRKSCLPVQPFEGKIFIQEPFKILIDDTRVAIEGKNITLPISIARIIEWPFLSKCANASLPEFFLICDSFEWIQETAI
ncbi:unnamed protein product [Allacma fusca]|uniref:Uncharacterized protein n=1 Tax=Allacma fusca TaxID=39272 RepID=A0A8J2PGX1_9HEXA|nr:unnamed protein product [Allacma fusca]